MTRLLVVLMLLAAPCVAQREYGVNFAGSEYLGGAAGNLLLRTPIVCKGWRKPLPRLFVYTSISLFYETVLDNNGWQHGKDFWEREAGYLITETVIALIRRKL